METKIKKKKLLNVLSIIYAISIIIIFTVFLSIATSKGIDKTTIIIKRFFIIMFFMIFGGVFLKFKEKIADFFYVRKNTTKFINKNERLEAIYQVRYMGTCMFIVGILLLLVTLISFLIA